MLLLGLGLLWTPRPGGGEVSFDRNPAEQSVVGEAHSFCLKG